MSNFEWYGNIPKNWNVKKGKYLYKFIQTGKKDSGENNPGGKYPFFTCSKEVLTIDEYSFDREALLVAGNGIVGETKYYNGKFDAYQRVYVISDFTSEIFVPYLTLYMTNNFIIYLTWRMIGSVINFVKLDDIKNFDISYPVYQTQMKIANFLENKSRKIEDLIMNQQQQIEKLKEYKQSLIREVVTKGLDPNVEFKESGIEWVGLIAKKSKLIQLKRLARINNGKEIRNVDGDIPVYGSGGIFKYTDEYLYEGESILYGRKGTIDKPLHVSGKFWTVDTMFYTEISKLVLPRYLYYISVGSINFDYYKSGSVLPSMTQFELGNVLMPVFDIKSQIEIVKYLDHKTNMIDRLIELKYTKINNIEEYKKSLIYEYVTVKKEVS